MQPPNNPGQFQPPPPNHTRRNAWLIILAIVLGGFTMIGILSPPLPSSSNTPATATPTVDLAIRATAFAQHNANLTAVVSTPIPTPKPTATPTMKPTSTPKPTATPTMKPTSTPTTVAGNLTATYGPPRLGGPITDFIGKYGKPDTDCATCASGIYNFQRYQGTGIDYISTMLTDVNGRTNAFDVQAPPNSDWDASTAKALCESFGPSDVNYDHPVQVLQSSDGTFVEKVYKSVWLAGQLDVSDFQDLNTTSNNTDLPPGTFDIFYTYPSSPSKVSDCSLEAGIQRMV